MAIENKKYEKIKNHLKNSIQSLDFLLMDSKTRNHKYSELRNEIRILKQKLEHEYSKQFK